MPPTSLAGNEKLVQAERMDVDLGQAAETRVNDRRDQGIPETPVVGTPLLNRISNRMSAMGNKQTLIAPIIYVRFRVESRHQRDNFLRSVGVFLYGNMR